MRKARYIYIIVLFYLIQENRTYADDKVNLDNNEEAQEEEIDNDKNTSKKTDTTESNDEKEDENNNNISIDDKENLGILDPSLVSLESTTKKTSSKQTEKIEDRDAPSATQLIKKNQKKKIRNTYLASMFLPGLGQIFNHKWWKAGIIWTGCGGFATGITLTHLKYIKNKKDYKSYRRWRNGLIVISLFWYVWNIFDAYVDAHMSTYDVSENLDPDVIPGTEKKVSLKKKRKERKKRKKKNRRRIK